MCSVIPFPLVCRRAFIRRHAARVASATPATGEKLLAHQIRLQATTMAKRGIAPDVIAAECKALENAIRAELWRVVLQPGGAA